MEHLLSDTEAAIKLGITKELLYAYIKYAPKKHLGHDRRLATTIKGGKNYFSETALIDFDNYLKEPWSSKNERRPEIPKYIQEYLKTEIGGKCPISGKGYPLDNAHIVDYSESLNHHHHNLIRIAKDEHAKIDSGIITRTLLHDVKRQLIESLRNELKVTTREFLGTFKPPKPHYLFVGRFLQMVDLIARMESERFIVIEGLGGIGKTELLLNALDNVRYHNPVLWIDVEAAGNFNDLLLILEKSVAHEAGIKNNGSLIDALRETQITLIFDSLEKLLINQRDEVEDFIRSLLSNTSKLQIIITSQIDLSLIDQEKEIIRVEGLQHHDSHFLLFSFISKELNITDEELSYLLDTCNGHPLALKLMGTLISFYNSATLAVERLKRNQPISHPTRNLHNKSTALNVCFQTIYDCLNDQQKQILHFTSFFPAGLKTKLIDRQFTGDFESDIAVLGQFFFVESRSDTLNIDRIFVPNPIRPFLRAIADSTVINLDTLQKEALENIVIEAIIVDHKYVENGSEDSIAYGVERFELELPNLLEAFRIAKEQLEKNEVKTNEELRQRYLFVIGGITSALGKFCFTTGDFENGIMFAKAGISANIEMGNIDSAVVQYMYLAQLQSRKFDLDGLEKTANDIDQLANSSSNRDVKAYANWVYGDLEFAKNHYAVARSYFEKALVTLQQMLIANEYAEGKSNHLDRQQITGNILILQFEIAKTFEFSGDFEKAIVLHREVLSHKGEGQLNLASNHNHLAHCLARTGKIEESMQFYSLAVEGFKKIKQYEYLANSISDMGMLIEDYVKIAEQRFLDEVTLKLALYGISYQLNYLLNKEAISVKNVPHQLLIKTLWIIKLISLSTHCFILVEWVQDILSQNNIDLTKPELLTAIIDLAHNVGGVEHWRNEPIKQKVINAIEIDCLLINGGPDLNSRTRIFYWLAMWMNRTKLNTTATAESLWEETWNRLENSKAGL